MDLHGLPPTYASTYVKQVYAVTPQQVSEMAKKHLVDDRATIVIVGDRKVIEEQVKGFGTLMDEVRPERGALASPLRGSTATRFRATDEHARTEGSSDDARRRILTAQHVSTNWLGGQSTAARPGGPGRPASLRGVIPGPKPSAAELRRPPALQNQRSRSTPRAGTRLALISAGRDIVGAKQLEPTADLRYLEGGQCELSVGQPGGVPRRHRRCRGAR